MRSTLFRVVVMCCAFGVIIGFQNCAPVKSTNTPAELSAGNALSFGVQSLSSSQPAYVLNLETMEVHDASQENAAALYRLTADQIKQLIEAYRAGDERDLDALLEQIAALIDNLRSGQSGGTPSPGTTQPVARPPAENKAPPTGGTQPIASVPTPGQRAGDQYQSGKFPLP